MSAAFKRSLIGLLNLESDAWDIQVFWETLLAIRETSPVQCAVQPGLEMSFSWMLAAGMFLCSISLFDSQPAVVQVYLHVLFSGKNAASNKGVH